jgi:hypothetical protein
MTSLKTRMACAMPKEVSVFDAECVAGVLETSCAFVFVCSRFDSTKWNPV